MGIAVGYCATTRCGMTKVIAKLNSMQGKGLFTWRMAVLIIVDG